MDSVQFEQALFRRVELTSVGLDRQQRVQEPSSRWYREGHFAGLAMRHVPAIVHEPRSHPAAARGRLEGLGEIHYSSLRQIAVVSWLRNPTAEKLEKIR